MINWIIRKKVHFIFWAGLAVLLISANPIYTHVVIRYGKPYPLQSPLPAPASAIVYQFGNLASIRYQGQDLYELRGFAFNQSAPLAKNKISIVLRSPAQTLVFATSPITIPGMIKSYQNYQPGMDQAEFSFFLSQAVLNPGTYQIGVLIESQSEPDRTYTLTGSHLTVTPNTITYTP